MNSDELFDRLPDLLFKRIREQMLLGIMPASTVESILTPLLSNFHELMLQLPPHLQADFENILRIYPDVAERFHLRIRPPFNDSLAALLRGRPSRPSLQAASLKPTHFTMAFAAESQKKLHLPGRPSSQEGQGFFRTDMGNSVYLEFVYQPEEDCVRFTRKPVHIGIELFICGMRALSIEEGGDGGILPLARLYETGERCVHDFAVELLEIR